MLFGFLNFFLLSVGGQIKVGYMCDTIKSVFLCKQFLFKNSEFKIAKRPIPSVAGLVFSVNIITVPVLLSSSSLLFN